MLFEKVKERKEREKGKACKPDSFVCPPNDLKSICFFTNCILLRPPTRWGPPCIAHAPSPPPPCPGHASLRLLLQGYACTRARALGRIIVSYLGCFCLSPFDILGFCSLFHFAQECKRLSIRGFDVPLFSPIS